MSHIALLNSLLERFAAENCGNGSNGFEAGNECWKHQDRVARGEIRAKQRKQKVRSESHAELLGQHSGERRELAADLRQEKKDLRKTHRTEHKELARDQSKEARSLQGRYDRALAKSSHPEKVHEEYSQLTSELKESHQYDLDNLKDQHKTEHKDMHDDHRSRAMDLRESHRAEQAEVIREALNEKHESEDAAPSPPLGGQAEGRAANHARLMSEDAERLKKIAEKVASRQKSS
jgi:hypothetical protein